MPMRMDATSARDDVAPLPFLNARACRVATDGQGHRRFLRASRTPTSTRSARRSPHLRSKYSPARSGPADVPRDANVHPSTALFFASRSSSAKRVLLNMYTASILSALVVRSKTFREGGGRRGACDEARSPPRRRSSITPSASPSQVAQRSNTWRGSRTAHLASVLLHKRGSVAVGADWRLVLCAGLACSHQWQECGLADDGR